MSNRKPIPASQCDHCGFSGLKQIKCYALNVICWLQASIEFVCERDTRNVPANIAIRFDELSNWMAKALRIEGVYSEGLDMAKQPLNSPETLRAWFELYSLTTGKTVPEAIENVLVGELTIWNRIGLIPTFGVSCMCCAGYRAWAALIVGLLLGGLVF
jgi:hypothetical protein